MRLTRRMFQRDDGCGGTPLRGEDSPACNLAPNLEQPNRGVLIFSVEQPPRAVAERFVSSAMRRSRIDLAMNVYTDPKLLSRLVGRVDRRNSIISLAGGAAPQPRAYASNWAL